MKVGLIGLGDQGAPMARAMARAGWDLHVWARRESSLEAVADVKHTVHARVADLGAACDIVGLCVRDDNDVEEMLETRGLLESMSPGSVIVNHGTGSPDICLEWDRRGKARQIAVLDAPVSGGREGAENLTLTTIVGGDREVFDRCKPVFESFSRKVVLMGPAGSGQLAKLVNNTLLAANMKNVKLALAIAEPLQLNVAALIDMLRSSSGSSFAIEAFATQMTAELAPHYQEMIGKDVRHFIKAAEQRGFKPEELTSAAKAGVAGIVATAETIRNASEGTQ